MTDLRAAAEMALKALQAIDDEHPYPIAKHAIVQLSKALAQPEQDPVVRWKCVYKSANGYFTETEYFYTDEEIRQCKGHTKLEYTRTEFSE